MSTVRGRKHPQQVPRGEKMIPRQDQGCLRGGKVGKTGSEQAELIDQRLREMQGQKKILLS